MFGLFAPSWKSRNKKKRLRAIESHSLDNTILLKLAHYDPSLEVRKAAILQIEALTDFHSLWLAEQTEEGKDFIIGRFVEEINKRAGSPVQIKELINELKTVFQLTNLRSFPVEALLLQIQSEEVANYLLENIIPNRALGYLVEKKAPLSLLEKVLQKTTNLSHIKRILVDHKGLDKAYQQLLRSHIHVEEERKQKDEKREELLIAYRILANSEPLAALNKLTEIDTAWAKLNPEGHEEKEESKLNEKREDYRAHYLTRYEEYSQAYRENQQRREEIHALLAGEIADPTLSQLHNEIIQVLEDTHLPRNEREKWTELQLALERKETEINQLRSQIKQTTILIKEAKSLLKTPYQIPLEHLEELQKRLEALLNKEQQGEKDEVGSHPSSQRNSDALVRQLTAIYARKELQKEEGTIHTTLNNQIKAFKDDLAKGQVKHLNQQIKAIDALFKAKGVALKKESREALMQAFNKERSRFFEIQKWARWGARNTLQSLIEEAKALKESENSSYIIDQLKRLRREWREASKNNRLVAKELHPEFDKACSDAFSNVEEERDSNREHRAFYIKEARSLLELFQKNVSEMLEFDGKELTNDRVKGNELKESELKEGRLSEEDMVAREFDWDKVQTFRKTFLDTWNQYLEQYSAGERITFGAPIFLREDKRVLEKEMKAILSPLNQKIREAQQTEVKRIRGKIRALETLGQTINDESKFSAIWSEFKTLKRALKPRLHLSYRDHRQLNRRSRRIIDTFLELQQTYEKTTAESQQQNKVKKQKIIEQMKNYLAQFSVDDLPEFYAFIDPIHEKWQEGGGVAKSDYQLLTQEYTRLRKKLFQRFTDLSRSKELERRKQEEELARQLGIVEERLMAQETVDLQDFSWPEKWENKALEKRHQCIMKIVNGNNDARHYLKELYKKQKESALHLILMKEILLNVPAQDNEKELRMQLQMSLLSEKMMEKTGLSKERELQKLKDKWYTQVVGQPDEILLERFFLSSVRDEIASTKRRVKKISNNEAKTKN